MGDAPSAVWAIAAGMKSSCDTPVVLTRRDQGASRALSGLQEVPVSQSSERRESSQGAQCTCLDGTAPEPPIQPLVCADYVDGVEHTAEAFRRTCPDGCRYPQEKFWQV
jgi:hypothetical protein